MTALEYIEWFINHNCYLDHEERPQVCFLHIFLRASHNLEEKSQVVSPFINL